MTAAVLLTLLTQVQAESDGLRVYRAYAGARATAWLPDVGGHFRADEGSVIGSKVRLDDDLGIEGEEVIGMYEFFVMPFPALVEGDAGIRLMYANHKWSASATLDNEERFAGSTFAAGSQVRSTLDFTNVGLGLFALGPDRRNGTSIYEVGGSFGFHYLKAGLDMESAVAHGSERLSGLFVDFGLKGSLGTSPTFRIGASADIYYGFVEKSAAYAASVFITTRWGPVQLEAAYLLFGFTPEEHRGDVRELRLHLAGPVLSFAIKF